MNVIMKFEAVCKANIDRVESLNGRIAEGAKARVISKDARFICYSIVGFDTNTISMLLGISPANVYTRRSRLKDRIRHLESPYKDQYQMCFSL